MLPVKILRRMLEMCPEAWYIFIRSIQLVAVLMLCAFALLLHSGGQGNGYELYMTAMALTETGQALLLIGVVASVCIEDQSSRS